jgi:phenylacetate-CoA ligase
MASSDRRSTYQAPAAARLRNTALLGLTGAAERAVPYLPEAAIDRIARRRMRATVQHAWDTVPFYRRAMDERGLRPHDFRTLEDLGKLPLIDGAFVQKHREEFVSSAVGRDSRKGFHTSGSATGVRRLIFWDDRSVLLKAARAERDRAALAKLAGETWTGTVLREFAAAGADGTLRRALLRVAGDPADHRRLSVAPDDHASRTYRAFWSQRTLLPNRATHYDFVSPDQSLDAVADRMERERPRVVFSFGSFANQFFAYLEESGRRPHLPRVWVYMADMVGERALHAADRLGCALWSVYACFEAGAVAFQCEHRNGFHVNVDLSPVRVVDDDGTTLPAGQTGDIVISNIHNRAMVLLNYRQGDRGAMATGGCECRRRLPLLARLEGRRTDVVSLGDGRTVSALALEGMFRGALRETRKAQIVQREPAELTWRVVPFAGADRERLRDGLVARGREALGEGTTVAVEFADDIPVTDQGKFLSVVQA